MKLLILCMGTILALTWGPAYLFGQSQPAQTPQQALAITLKQLGACQSQLGPLTGLQADVVAGVYVDWPTVKQVLEAANPTMQLDLKTHKVTSK